jgi:hypothetical protein
MGIAVPLLLLELTLRQFGPVIPGNYETGVWAQGDSVVGHFHIPGATAWIREPEFTTYLRFNSLGLRGAEAQVPKPTDRFRVLVLGDSFVEAKQVDEDISVTEQLNARFSKAGKSDIRALNGGVFDWSPVHELLYLQEAGPRLRPDLVVQFFYIGNDVTDLWPRSHGELRDLGYPLATVDDDGDLIMLPWKRSNPDESESVVAALSRRSAVARMMETGVVDKMRYSGHGGDGLEGHVVELFRGKATSAENRAWRTVEATLVETHDAAERMGAQYALVIVPAKWQVHREDWSKLISGQGQPDDRDWYFRGPDRRLSQIADAHSIPVLDLLPVLRNAAASGERLYYQRDIHWNPAGHTVAAAAVFDFLANNELFRDGVARVAAPPTLN